MDVFYYQIVEGITFNKSYFINSVVIYYLRLDSHLKKIFASMKTFQN